MSKKSRFLFTDSFAALLTSAFQPTMRTFHTLYSVFPDRRIVQHLLLSGGLVWMFTTEAHTQSGKKYTVSSGEVTIEVLPPQSRFRFPEFKRGKVIFQNDKALPGLLNYNLLYREAQFIDGKQDTLSFANEHMIKKVIIGDSLFYYHSDYGYLEVIADFSTVKLACNQGITLVREEKPENIRKIDNIVEKFENGKLEHRYFSPLDQQKTARELFTQKATYPLVLALKETYYFVDHNERIHPARKSSIRKIYPGHRRRIFQFLDEENIRFTDAKDLELLLQFCGQLY